MWDQELGSGWRDQGAEVFAFRQPGPLKQTLEHSKLLSFLELQEVPSRHKTSSIFQEKEESDLETKLKTSSF